LPETSLLTEKGQSLFAASPEEYGKYQYLFDRETFPRTWIESAFAFKRTPLLLSEDAEPAMALLLYPHKAFVTGEPSASDAAALLDRIPAETEIFVDEGKWLPRLKEHFKGRLIQKTRIKMAHEALELKTLARLKRALPAGFRVQRATRAMVERLPPLLNVHIAPFFGTATQFLTRGVGFCVLHGHAPISMASSCIPYTNRLEVQVATRDSAEYRRRGFGTAACVALLEHCLHHGIEPHWDAFNPRSASMAKKLGYINPEPYSVYKWRHSGKVRRAPS
jgi:hypothetical protein